MGYGEVWDMGMCGTWGYGSLIFITGVPKERERQNEAKAISEKIISENFFNNWKKILRHGLKKCYKPQAEQTQRKSYLDTMW